MNPGARELFEEYEKGYNDALRHVLASLREYPNAGGDVDIMHEVERIESRAFIRGTQVIDLPEPMSLLPSPEPVAPHTRDERKEP